MNWASRLKRYAYALRTLVWKDSLLERRGLETIVMTTGFALLVIVMFHFTFDIRSGEAARFFPGALWTALFFAGTVGMARSGASDESGGRDLGLILAPIDRSALFLGKLLFHFGLLLIVEVVTVPLFVVSFGLGQIASPQLLVGALLLGSWGMAALGTLLAGVTGGGRGTGLMLPLVLFPLLVPVALGAAALVQAAVTGETTSLTTTWLRVLFVFDLVFTIIPALFYEYLLEG